MKNPINYKAMSLDDIIFIDRNKEYGAYQLRKSYRKNSKRAIIGMVLFSACILAYQSIHALWHPSLSLKKVEIVCRMTEIKTPVIKSPTLPPAEQKTEQIKKGKTNAATTAVLQKKAVKDNTPTQDTIAPLDLTADMSDHTYTGEKGEPSGSEKGTSPIEVPKTDVAPNNGQPFISVEKMPEYPGGEKALLSFIRDHLRYPAYESELGIHGKAVIGFVIDENGKVTDVSVVKGVSKGLDRESVRVIKMLQDFTPGMQSGRTVKVRFIIPIDFNSSSD